MREFLSKLDDYIATKITNSVNPTFARVEEEMQQYEHLHRLASDIDAKLRKLESEVRVQVVNTPPFILEE